LEKNEWEKKEPGGKEEKIIIFRQPYLLESRTWIIIIATGMIGVLIALFFPCFAYIIQMTDVRMNTRLMGKVCNLPLPTRVVPARNFDLWVGTDLSERERSCQKPSMSIRNGWLSGVADLLFHGGSKSISVPSLELRRIILLIMVKQVNPQP
jgi:hypothetical protein